MKSQALRISRTTHGELTRHGLARGTSKSVGFLPSESSARLSLFDYATIELTLPVTAACYFLTEPNRLQNSIYKRSLVCGLHGGVVTHCRDILKTTMLVNNRGDATALKIFHVSMASKYGATTLTVTDLSIKGKQARAIQNQSDHKCMKSQSQSVPESSWRSRGHFARSRHEEG